MFTLNQVVPWGRSFDEYQRMFALTQGDLQRTILGCGDGPASFNAEATRHGLSVVSCDPLYQWSGRDIQARIAETYDDVLEQTRRNADEFVWREIGSVDALGRMRMAAMQTFLADYEAGKREARYLDAALPSLPFEDDAFELALCSHFLFLYSQQFGAEFHVQSLGELCRVAAEVRVFPLLGLGGAPSPHLDQVLEALTHRGMSATVDRVPYEFQRGGNEMLRVRRS